MSSQSVTSLVSYKQPEIVNRLNMASLRRSLLRSLSFLKFSVSESASAHSSATSASASGSSSSFPSYLCNFRSHRLFTTIDKHGGEGRQQPSPRGIVQHTKSFQLSGLFHTNLSKHRRTINTLISEKKVDSLLDFLHQLPSDLTNIKEESALKEACVTFAIGKLRSNLDMLLPFLERANEADLITTEAQRNSMLGALSESPFVFEMAEYIEFLSSKHVTFSHVMLTRCAMLFNASNIELFPSLGGMVKTLEANGYHVPGNVSDAY